MNQKEVNTAIELPIMEFFYTIQGEGFYSGRAAFFIRIAGCDVGCVWCDVKDSWDSEKHPLQTIDFLIEQVVTSGTNLVVITGGEPAMYDLTALTNFEKFTVGSQITFSKYEHDFGTVKKGKKLKQSFYFVNSGDAPLVISNAKGSCGCTIPFFPKDPIQPGEKGQIDIEIDANNKESDKVFEVSVKVESNAENNLVKLKLKGIPQE